MKRTQTISIAKEFSTEPIGRYPEDNDFCGENFRDKFLVVALNEYDEVVVRLDGTEGFGSSFLEEAFGGLVRLRGFTQQDLKSRLILVSDEDETLITEIWEYINEAKPKQ